MSLNAFMQISNAKGESRQGDNDLGNGNYKDWIEIQNWEWDVEAESSWTKGGGASVGKANPGKMSWEHYWDRSSATLLLYICTGAAFDSIKLEMAKTTGSQKPQAFFTVVMKEAFITKVTQSATEEGNVTQKIEMVFKDITIEYFQQGRNEKMPGMLSQASRFHWDIPGGKANV